MESIKSGERERKENQALTGYVMRVLKCECGMIGMVLFRKYTNIVRGNGK